MLPRETLDRFETPDGHTFTLIRHDRDFYIDIDGLELMSTRRTGSEVALAKLGCDGLERVAKPRVLVGGLGFGFTLRAALCHLPKDGRLVVAELFPKVVEWNKEYLELFYQGDLQDRRLKIVVADVWETIGEGSWNSILLDTDNGPEFFCLPTNSRLYGRRGLVRLREALVPGGVVAVWSADAQPRFVRELQRAGFEAHFEMVRERGSRGQSYAIYFGKNPSRIGRQESRPGKRQHKRGRRARKR